MGARFRSMLTGDGALQAPRGSRSSTWSPWRAPGPPLEGPDPEFRVSLGSKYLLRRFPRFLSDVRILVSRREKPHKHKLQVHTYGVLVSSPLRLDHGESAGLVPCFFQKSSKPTILRLAQRRKNIAYFPDFWPYFGARNTAYNSIFLLEKFTWFPADVGFSRTREPRRRKLYIISGRVLGIFSAS